MEVIGHHAIGQDAHPRSLPPLAQHSEERTVVVGLVEQPKSPGATVHDVEHDTGGLVKIATWHAGSWFQTPCHPSKPGLVLTGQN
jgi:hypothetical protein